MNNTDQTAGQLIKSGKFREAMPLVAKEIKLALRNGVAREEELFAENSGLLNDFFLVLLNPNDFDFVQQLGNRFINLEMRIPNYLTKVSESEYKKNVESFYASIKS